MRERLQKWAEVFGVIGLALLAFTLASNFLPQVRGYWFVPLILGAIFIALYVWARPQQVRAAMTSRGATYGSSTIIGAVLFIGAIVLLNWLSVNRWNQRIDYTANKSQSLSDQTIKVLQDLKEPIKVTAFYVTQRTDPQTLQAAEDKFKQYAQVSDKFTYRFVDPQMNPQLAFDYKYQVEPTIVFERGARRENAFSADEQAITNALVKVSQDKQKVVYFTQGHGERSIDDNGENGISGIKSRLEAFNFKTDSLNLRAITATLPADTAALVIAGPRQKFDADEVQRVKDYLKNSGRVFVMLDPQFEHGLETLLKEWGINARNDVILDPQLSIPGRPQHLVVNTYKNHATTTDLTGFTMVVSSARSLFADNPPPSGKFATALFASGPNAWGETDFDSLKNQTAKLDPNVDVKGPLDLAYAVEASGENPARLVAMGNATFLTNGVMRAYQGNVNDFFLLGVVQWLGGQESLISIPPKTFTPRNLIIPLDEQLGVLATSICLLPGAISVIGLVIWVWRRR